MEHSAQLSILPGLALCPDMPLSEYVGLLAKMAMHFERIRKL
jgi:hypothetical protein